MANATIAAKYITNPRNTWDGTEKIPLDVSGADGVGLASTLAAYVLASPTITGHATIEGATLTGKTGSGLLVLATSPTLVTPVLGVAAATSLQLGTVSSVTGALNLANSGSANLTTIQAGNAAAARTYTWPTNFGAAGGQLTDVAGNGTLSWVDGITEAIEYSFDGGGSAIAAATVRYLEVPTGCTVARWTLLADVSTTSTVDIWRCTYANYAPPTHPAVGDTIVGSGIPTITAALKGQSAPTGWGSTVLVAGDILGFNVTSNNNAKTLTVSLLVTRT